MANMRIGTIGFTKTTAESFFQRLRESGLPLLIDVRLHRDSQLAGFARGHDMPYFLRELAGMEYAVESLLMPEMEDFTAYRGKKLTWDGLAERYVATLAERKVERHLDRAQFAPGVVLLCSEATPTQCHRRLAAEYLANKWKSVEVVHL